MVELVDTQVSKTCGLKNRDGSIPSFGTMWWQIIISIVGVVGYLYFNWRILRENYKEEEMVAFGWVSLLLFLVGNRLIYAIFNFSTWPTGEEGRWLEFWKMWQSGIWGGYLLWLLGALIVSQDREWKFLTFAEDNLRPLFWLTSSVLLASMNWSLLLASGISMLGYWFFYGKYRSFLWYKSGKKGFLFLMVNILFFLTVSVISKNWWFIIVSLICGVGLIMLGNDKLSKKIN